MLKGTTKNVRNDQVGHLFTWNQSNDKPGFELKADSNKQFEQVLAQLKKDIEDHQLRDGLFTSDPATLTIKLTKANFIRWQKAVLTSAIGGKPRILLRERKFFQYGDKYFTIPLKKETANGLRHYFLKKTPENNDSSMFVATEEGVVEIAAKDYPSFREKILIKRKSIKVYERKFQKDEEANCYFTLPTAGETLQKLLKSLRSVLTRQKKMTKGLSINNERNRVEMDGATYKLIDELVQKISPPKISAIKRIFHEYRDGFYTQPTEHETLQELHDDLHKYFESKHKQLKIDLKLDEENKCVRLSKSQFILWKETANKQKPGKYRISRRSYVFDKETNDYIIDHDNKDIHVVYRALKDTFKRLSIPLETIRVNFEKKEIRIAKEDYELFVERDKKSSAEKSSVYGVMLTKDEKRDVYYFDSKMPKNKTESFNALATLVGAKVKFHNRNKRTEISAEDYKCWTENPIISQSLSNHHQKYQGVGIHGFSFDEEKNCYVKHYSKKTLSTAFLRFEKKCKKYLFTDNLFQKDEDVNQVKISADNYKKYIEACSIDQAKKCHAYKSVLIKDEKKDVYYCPNQSKQAVHMLRSFKKIAELLAIDVNFVKKQGRVELSLEHYERWIANPIIRESLGVTDTTSTISQPLSIHNKNNKILKRTDKTQTTQNTKGGVSVKYLEDALTVPWKLDSEPSIQKQASTLPKNHVIPFVSLQEALLDTDNKRRFSATVTIDSQGIKGMIKFYSSQKDTADNVFSKNVIFVRAGRKEAAFLPKFDGKEQCTIILMVSRSEFNEMQVTLGRTFVCKLPPYIKCCIIESCKVKKQALSEHENYLRTCNIKRIVAYAIADYYQLNDFVLMDDNTHHIQMAEKVSSGASIQALFQLFRAYKERGAVCLTLGSYAPFKNIARPLEASEIEDLEQRLGTKIAYIDFETIKKELQAQNKELHEILSPCSLYWGEDYFNMLAIIQLMQKEGNEGLAGVIPYSMAWHERNHSSQNKAKSNKNFQLANAWLRLEDKVIENLTEHQQLVVARLKELVRDAIKKQKRKEQKYLEQLEITNDEPTMIQEERESLEEIASPQELSVVELGSTHGARHAKRGYPFDVDKLTQRMNGKYKPQYIEQYTKGFKTGHEAVWSSLSEKKRTYYRGEYEGFLAARQGFKTDKCRIPSLYQAHQSIFLKGFNNGNMLQWKSMRETDNLSKVKTIAEEMGIKRANTGYDINEQKLAQIAKNFGDNAEYFMEQYRAEFNLERSLMLEEEIVTKKAQQLAIMLAQKPDALDVKKLEQTSKAFGNLKDLYQQTVTMQFEKLRQQQQQSKGNKLDNNKLQRKSAKAL